MTAEELGIVSDINMYIFIAKEMREGNLSYIADIYSRLGNVFMNGAGKMKIKTTTCVDMRCQSS